MKKALLINDSKFENLIMQDMLNRLDFEVEIASEFDALYEVEQFRPDLVIVNFIMQDIRGDQLIELIKAKQANATCLLSSSSSIHSDDFGKHVDGILRTPVSMFSLQDLLKRVGMMGIEVEKVNPKQSQKLADKNANLQEGEGVLFCPGCDSDLSQFGNMIVFCPFCGEDLS